MSRKDGIAARRWAGLAALAMLLGLCLILLDGAMTAAQGSPEEEAAPRRAESAGPGALAMNPGTGYSPGPQQVNPGFTVDLAYDAVWGLVDAGDLVTVTRAADGAYGAAEADGVGFFWTPLWQGNGRAADIADGDTIEIYVNGGLAASIPVLEVTGGIDVLADQALGTIPGDTGGTLVTVTLGLEGAQPPANAPQATATTNSAGNFAAAFAGVDLGASSLAVVEYAHGGSRVRAAYLYPNERVFEVWNQRTIRGYADSGQAVDVTVYQGGGPAERWSGSGTAGEPHGFYNIGLAGPGDADAAQVGDLVEVDLGDGEVLATVIAGLGITRVDAALDQIDGIAPPGETVVIRLWQLDGYAQTTVTAGGDGVFAADLSGIADLRPRDVVRAVLADAEGDESLLWSGAPYLDALLNPSDEWDCVVWRADGPFLPVTLTIQTSTGVYTRENPIGPSDAGNTGGNGCYLIWGPDWGPIDFAPGDTVTLRSPTWEGSLVIPEVTWRVDAAEDQVSGNAPPGDLEVYAHQWYGDQYPIHGSAVQTGAAASPYTVSFSGFDVRDGGWVEIRHFDPASDFATHPNPWGNLASQHFEAEIGGGVEGVAPSHGEVVTAILYTAEGAELASSSEDRDGDPWHFEIYFDKHTIVPGLWVTVTSESGWTAGLQVPELTVEVDADSDLIWGEGPKATILVDHHGEGTGDQYFVPVDGYILDLAHLGVDVNRPDEIAAIYQAPSGNRVRSLAVWPWMFVNYGDDHAGGVYALGHTFGVTVTDEGGTPKAWATVSTGPDGGDRDGNWKHGFTVKGEEWSPSAPDIQPGDRVHFQTDGGYSSTVHVGTITGVVDAEADTVSGSLEVPWLASQTIQCTVGAWGFTFAQDSVDLDADGKGTYFVDFSPNDVTPDMELGVRYEEPGGNSVYNRLRAMQALYLPIVLKGHTP